jgi:2'-5' RNA ligase
MTFTSCFIGIPLPPLFQADFERVLRELALIHPGLKLVQKSTPHLTLYYLDDQAQNNLESIADEIKESVAKLKKTEITIGGLGVFDPGFPRVLYLNVTYPPVLEEVNTLFRKQLNSYYAADNNLPFHPHLTVARIPNDEARALYRQKERAVEELLKSVAWHFVIDQVVIYGVDSRLEPERQQKLITINV